MPRKDNLQGLVSRRQFLQSAALGTAVAYLGSGEAVAQNNGSVDDNEIVSGSLVAVTDGWVEIQGKTDIKRIPLNPNTFIWKGGRKAINSLAKGDDIMIRTSISKNTSLRIWSNLDRVLGQVVRVDKQGVILSVGRHKAQQKEMYLNIGNDTVVGDTASDGIPAATRKIAVGDSIDAIGETTSEGIRGTLIQVLSGKNSGDAPSLQQGPDEVIVGPNATCTYSYYGIATWFYCATGAGRCRCDSTSSNECAWPAMDSCGCCSSTCCDCSKNCKGQGYLSCGNSVTCIQRCVGTSRLLFIKDCGPCQKANCNGCSPDLCGRTCTGGCVSVSAVIIDLTRPTFAAYGLNPDQTGCFQAKVNVNFAC